MGKSILYPTMLKTVLSILMLMFSFKCFGAYPSVREFPIIAVTVRNAVPEINRSELQQVVACGFNLCMENMSDSHLEQLLDSLDGTGLKVIANNNAFRISAGDSDWRKGIKECVNKFKHHPNLWGWNFGDEPRWDKLGELGVRYKYLRELDPRRFVSLNFVGQLAPDFTGPCKTLEAYVDTVQKYFDLDIWSSDFYPIMIRNGNFIVDYKGYYTDLEVFSQKSKETGKPMWTYLESMEYTSNHHSRPAATVPYLTFEAFSSLAYGAQGIVYWTYYQRPSNAVETYLSALVNLDGQKTPAWYAAQKVNLQIRALTDVFLGAKKIECKHTGNIGLADVRPFISDFGPLSRLSNEEKGVLVSHLQNKGRNYLVIVNHDVQKKQKVSMRFKDGKRVRQIRVDNKYQLKRKTPRSTSSLTLDPGGYAVFEWE